MANSMDGQNSVLSVVGPLAPTAGSLRLATKALLAQQPWLHDPLVHEIPWRSEQESSILSLLHSLGQSVAPENRLSIALLRTDGIVTPTPPIARALDLVSTALKSAGHEIIPWTPPSHKTLNETGFRSWVFDGGADVRSAFSLSNEPMSPQISLYSQDLRAFTATEIAETNVQLRELRKEHMEYWNSTSTLTSTGRAVDAVISPLAPWPAARKERYKYYGYTTWVNALDYTSVAFPVTNVDKTIDVKNEDFKAVDEKDGEIQDDCTFPSFYSLFLPSPLSLSRKTLEMGICANVDITDDPSLYANAHTSLQVVGRRLQEEKMVALAEYIGALIGK
jgi:amidase